MRPFSSHATATGSTTIGSAATNSTFKPGSVFKYCNDCSGASGPSMAQAWRLESSHISHAKSGQKPADPLNISGLLRNGRLNGSQLRPDRCSQAHPGTATKPAASAKYGARRLRLVVSYIFGGAAYPRAAHGTPLPPDGYEEWYR